MSAIIVQNLCDNNYRILIYHFLSGRITSQTYNPIEHNAAHRHIFRFFSPDVASHHSPNRIINPSFRLLRFHRWLRNLLLQCIGSMLSPQCLCLCLCQHPCCDEANSAFLFSHSKRDKWNKRLLQKFTRILIKTTTSTTEQSNKKLTLHCIALHHNHHWYQQE